VNQVLRIEPDGRLVRGAANKQIAGAGYDFILGVDADHAEGEVFGVHWRRPYRCKQLATISDDATVTFEFDGSALIIRCAGKVIPMAGEGDPWPRSYSVKAGSIRELPTRLMQQNVEISVWERSLILGNRRYSVISNELT
jgi:hypothetical protein